MLSNDLRRTSGDQNRRIAQKTATQKGSTKKFGRTRGIADSTSTPHQKRLPPRLISRVPVAITAPAQGSLNPETMDARAPGQRLTPKPAQSIALRLPEM